MVEAFHSVPGLVWFWVGFVVGVLITLMALVQSLKD